MAIQNASDLLVYKYTTPAQQQITRVFVLTTAPLIFPEGTSTGNIKINNVVNTNGDITDDVATPSVTANTGADVLAKIGSTLASLNGYTASGTTVVGDYTYRDFTNATSEVVPTLSFKNGTASLVENAINVEVIQPGQSLVYQPVAHSTSASISVNRDLRDVTTKDSLGWSQSLSGLQSVELSTDALVDLSENVNVKSFIDDLKSDDYKILKYSDRIKNIVKTENVWGEGSGFAAQSSATIGLNYYNFMSPPQQTAAQVAATTGSGDGIRYMIGAAELETYGSEFTISFYVKGVTTNLDVVFYVILVDSAGSIDKVLSLTSEGGLVKILSGPGSLDTIGNKRRITSLSNTSWTRVSISFVLPTDQSLERTIRLVVFPGDDDTSQSGEAIRVGNYQLEIGNNATDYQNPTEIDCYSGRFLTSGVSLDAGVEENATFSSSFTSTGQVYKNGLGPELIGDTGFNNPGYWTFPGPGGTSVVEAGYAKIRTTGNANSYVYKAGIFPHQNTGSAPNKYKYIMVYTVPPEPSPHTGVGAVSIFKGNGAGDYKIPVEPGVHKIELYPQTLNLEIKRASSTTDAWFSDISIKLVSPID